MKNLNSYNYLLMPFKIAWNMDSVATMSECVNRQDVNACWHELLANV